MSRLITNAIRSTSASADAITMDGSGNVTFPANATCSGTATGFGGGKLLQVQQTVKTDTASEQLLSGVPSSTIFLPVNITPASASNKILITVTANVSDHGTVVLILQKNGSNLDAATGDADGNRRRVPQLQII